MIDLHSHLLPGIDDGPPTMDAALRMAEAAVDAGTTVMACTPHISGRYPETDPSALGEAAGRLREALDRAGVPLQVTTGAEIALDRLPLLGDAALRDAALGGTGRWLLLEMPWKGWPVRLPEMLVGLEVRGLGAVLAHPERAESVQYEPQRMRDLVGRGALVQINASSLRGDHGRVARQCAGTLLRNGLVHFIASDAHSADTRPPGLADGLAEAARVLRVEPEDLRWMVEDGPRAVLAGETVRPPRLGVRRPARPETPAGPAPAARRPRREPSGGGERRPRGRHTSR